jgi:hypothetical protein
MPSVVRSSLRVLIACMLVALFAIAPQNLSAQTHVVSPSDLQRATAAASQSRQNNIATLDRFFSSPVAQKALKDARIDAAQVKTGVATLSDAELAKLATRAADAQKNFAAGALADHALVLIVLAIAVIVIIIIAVKV